MNYNSNWKKTEDADALRSHGGDGRMKGPAFVGCAARLIAWGVAALSVRALFAGGWLLRGLDAAFLFVFGRSFGSSVESAVSVVVSLGLFALLLEGVLGDRAPVFKPYLRAVAKTLGLLPKAAWWSIRLIFLVVEGKPLPSLGGKPERARKPSEEA